MSGGRADCTSGPAPESPGAANRPANGRRRSSKCATCWRSDDAGFPMTLWVNGALVPDDAAVIRADDHGLVVGDGVFETMSVENGVPFALTRHLNRLHRSAAGLGIEVDDALVRQGIDAVLADRPDFVRLRVTVTGGPSPYGSDRGSGAPTLMVSTGPMKTWPPTADGAIVPWTRHARSATARPKTTSFPDNAVAPRHAPQRPLGDARPQTTVVPRQRRRAALRPGRGRGGAIVPQPRGGGVGGDGQQHFL